MGDRRGTASESSRPANSVHVRRASLRAKSPAAFSSANLTNQPSSSRPATILWLSRRIESSRPNICAPLRDVSDDDRLPWLFVSERGQPMTRQAVNYLIREAGERAGLGRAWPQMLRHSAGYVLSNKGYDFRLLQGGPL